MTVIASFSVRRHPVMLGDLLLSGPERDEQIVRIPSVGPITKIFPKGSGYTITGLKQKLAVIHPDLAMAWAGSYIKARCVATELKQLVSKNEINLDSISAFLKEVQEDNALQDLSLILLVSNRQAGLVHTLWVRAGGYTTDHYGRVCIAGSGHEDMVSLLKDVERSEMATQSDRNPVNLAIFYAGSVAGRILTSDVTSRQSLLRYYGGGSEILTLNGGEFSKVDNLAYVMWVARVVNQEKIEMFDPIRIIYYSYRQDHLYIHALEFDPYADKAHRITDNTRYLIDPIYRSNRLNAITEFERESCYEPCHFVHMVQVVDSSGEQIIGQFQLFRTKVGNPDISVNFGPEDKISLTTKGEFVKSILTRVRNLVLSKPENCQ